MVKIKTRHYCKGSSGVSYTVGTLLKLLCPALYNLHTDVAFKNSTLNLQF